MPWLPTFIEWFVSFSAFPSSDLIFEGCYQHDCFQLGRVCLPWSDWRFWSCFAGCTMLWSGCDCSRRQNQGIVFVCVCLHLFIDPVLLRFPRLFQTFICAAICKRSWFCTPSTLWIQDQRTPSSFIVSFSNTLVDFASNITLSLQVLVQSVWKKTSWLCSTRLILVMWSLSTQTFPLESPVSRNTKSK